jgi:hypothetical protein
MQAKCPVWVPQEQTALGSQQADNLVATSGEDFEMSLLGQSREQEELFWGR